MAKRRGMFRGTSYREIRKGSRAERIRIPAAPKHPIRIITRDVLRREALRSDPQWFVEHRRGIRQTWIGEDPLEARAVPHDQVVGFLSERIVYKWLTTAHFVPGVDFTYQSSLEGGRLELGGMVADFLFPGLLIALRIQGPGHEEHARKMKDEEQRLILEDMGFGVVDLEVNIIYDAYYLDIFMRKLFNMYAGGGASGYAASEGGTYQDGLDDLETLLRELSGAIDQAYQNYATVRLDTWDV